MTAAGQPGEMADEGGASTTKTFVRAGLKLLELEAGDDELAVIEAVDALYRPLTQSLIDAELDGIAPEPGADMSRAPRALEQR